MYTTAIFIAIACLLCFCTVDAAPPLMNAANPTVTIASGVVIGTATGVLNQPAVTGLVNAYLGVPFASPPERFSPPSAPSAWSTPITAQLSKPACIQEFSYGGTSNGQALAEYLYNNPGGPPPPESEDCLYLNIFAPQDANPSTTKPVMFYVYGGSPQFGWAGNFIYNGSSLAVNHDVVVVVANFRTNLFGFPNAPQLNVGEANIGLLDQRLALQWVQQNINAFGGDHTQVTIFGQSAGGWFVKQLLALPPSPLPFAAAIMQSEGEPAGNTTGWATATQHYNCTNTTTQLDCMRQVDATDIKNYISETGLSFTAIYDSVTCLDNHGVDATIEAGTFAKVPILIGSTLNEGTVFAYALGLDNLTGLAGIDTPTTLVNIVLEATGINISVIIDLLLITYPLGIVNSGVYLLASQIITDLAFTCPTSIFASSATENGYDVWRYLYSAVIPNEQKFPDAGAWHSSDIAQVWGSYPSIGATTTQFALSKYLQGVWSGFAKNPSAGTGWARYGSGLLTPDVGVLGGSANPTGESTIFSETLDYICAVYGLIDYADDDS